MLLGAGLLLCSCGVLMVNPETAADCLSRGKAFLERGEDGDLKHAVEAFMCALDKAQDADRTLRVIRESLFAAAERYREQGNRAREAACYLAYTENFDAESIEAYIKLVRFHQRMGNLSGALSFAKRAYRLDPGNREVLLLMKELDPI